MKTKLYVIKATNPMTKQSCLISAYFDEMSAMDTAEFCHSRKTTTNDSYLISMHAIDSYVRQIYALNQNQIQLIKKVSQFFTCGLHAGCSGMHDISIIQKKFDSDFEALAEMAVIKLKSNKNNLQMQETLDEA